MRNYKLEIEYEGTNYAGWQRLPGDKITIQGLIEKAISQVIGYEVTIDGSGRTDTGVHARSQVANVKISRKVDEDKFKEEINDILPKNIRITDIELVKNSFHSRYNAKAKKYIYTIDMAEKQGVFTRKISHHCPENLDVDKMERACTYLVGTYDYTSFSDKKSNTNNVRTIHSIDIKRENNLLIFTYSGNGFLNHMVRIVTGTLIEVGMGKRKPEDMKYILESKSRAKAGIIAPAIGLCLAEVTY